MIVLMLNLGRESMHVELCIIDTSEQCSMGRIKPLAHIGTAAFCGREQMLPMQRPPCKSPPCFPPQQFSWCSAECCRGDRTL